MTKKWNPEELATDPEKMLILLMLRVAEKDAMGKFQGTNVNKEKTKASARRFLASDMFGYLCEFVGGDAGVIRKRVV